MCVQYEKNPLMGFRDMLRVDTQGVMPHAKIISKTISAGMLANPDTCFTCIISDLCMKKIRIH